MPPRTDPSPDLHDSLKQHRWLMFSLIIIWISHFLQVLTPETGYDALWYHLPVAKLVVQHHGLIFVPTLYQTANPLFSDLFFIFGYLLFGSLGTKLVAYIFGLVLTFVSYRISRLILDQKWSLTAIIAVSLIQVVAWQSASFYVDVAKSVWELGAVYVLIVALQKPKLDHKKLILSGLLFGASLGTKLFSVLLFPFFILGIGYKNVRKVVIFIISSLIIPLPFLLFAYIHTGDPFFSLTHHLGILSDIGSENNLFIYLIKRTLLLPLSPLYLITARDYIVPGLLLAFPLLFTYRKKIFVNKKLSILSLFTLSQYLIWWYVPPLSTRYALSGFITLTILLMWGLKELSLNLINKQTAIKYFLVIVLVLNFLPRLYVNIRSLRYITGKQSTKAYLEQFKDGWIDPHIEKWYSKTK